MNGGWFLLLLSGSPYIIISAEEAIKADRVNTLMKKVYLLYSLLLILLLDYVLLLGSRVLSQINGIGLISVTTLGARGWTTMVKLSLLSHACSHEGLRI